MNTLKANAVQLKAECGVRYWEDAEVNGVEDIDGTLIPCRDGKAWNPTIDLKTGKIINWPEGTTASIHYKVCDDGRYTLLDADGAALATIDGYVPKVMCPGDSGYGDYVIMNVKADGSIENWRNDLQDFRDARDQ